MIKKYQPTDKNISISSQWNYIKNDMLKKNRQFTKVDRSNRKNCYSSIFSIIVVGNSKLQFYSFYIIFFSRISLTRRINLHFFLSPMLSIWYDRDMVAEICLSFAPASWSILSLNNLKDTTEFLRASGRNTEGSPTILYRLPQATPRVVSATLFEATKCRVLSVGKIETTMFSVILKKKVFQVGTLVTWLDL